MPILQSVNWRCVVVFHVKCANFTVSDWRCVVVFHVKWANFTVSDWRCVVVFHVKFANLQSVDWRCVVVFPVKWANFTVSGLTMCLNWDCFDWVFDKLCRFLSLSVIFNLVHCILCVAILFTKMIYIYINYV